MSDPGDLSASERQTCVVVDIAGRGARFARDRRGDQAPPGSTCTLCGFVASALFGGFMVGGWRWRGASASSEVRRCICSVVGVAQQPSCSLCVFLPKLSVQLSVLQLTALAAAARFVVDGCKLAQFPRRTPPLPKMCKDNVDLPKEANKAKCFAIACFILCASPGHTWARHMRGHHQ